MTENNKTAMCQMLEYLIHLKKETTDPSESYMITNLISHALYLAAIEEVQITKAWESGFTAHKTDEKYGIDKTEFSADKYYDNNYKRK